MINLNSSSVNFGSGNFHDLQPVIDRWDKNETEKQDDRELDERIANLPSRIRVAKILETLSIGSIVATIAVAATQYMHMQELHKAHPQDQRQVSSNEESNPINQRAEKQPKKLKLSK